jgi:hypothetical protein
LPVGAPQQLKTSREVADMIATDIRFVLQTGEALGIAASGKP